MEIENKRESQNLSVRLGIDKEYYTLEYKKWKNIFSVSLRINNTLDVYQSQQETQKNLRSENNNNQDIDID